MKLKYIDFKNMANTLYSILCRNDCGGERARRVVTGILTQDVNVEMPQELYDEMKSIIDEANTNMFGHRNPTCGEADYM